MSFVFGSFTEYAEWKADLKKDGYDLAAALLMEALKAIVAAALVVGFIAAILFFIMIAFSGAAVVLVVGVATVFAGVLANYWWKQWINIMRKNLG